MTALAGQAEGAANQTSHSRTIGSTPCLTTCSLERTNRISEKSTIHMSYSSNIVKYPPISSTRLKVPQQQQQQQQQRLE